jgi:hypothetical protein
MPPLLLVSTRPNVNFGSSIIPVERSTTGDHGLALATYVTLSEIFQQDFENEYQGVQTSMNHCQKTCVFSMRRL